MAKLPFVVEPRRKPIIERIGNDETGILEVERRGYLTTGEKAFVQQVQQFDDGTSQIVTVSRRVAKAYGISMEKAYNAIIAIISANKDEGPNKELHDKIEEEFAEDLTNIVKSIANAQIKESLIFAACLLQYRVDTNFQIDDINELHPDLIEGLAALYRDEDRRSLEAFKKDEAETATVKSIEEAEKKQEKGIKSRSKTTTGD